MDFPTPVRASFESTLWADVECIVCDAQQARPLSSIPSTRRRTTGTSLSIFRPHMHLAEISHFCACIPYERTHEDEQHATCRR